MRRWRIAGTVLLAGACAQDRVGQGASGLVGGTPTYEYPAVLLLESPDGGFCTGSLVAPEVVLTAAHCQLAPGWTASVMSYDQPIASAEVVEVVTHRYHNGGDAFSDHDIALARLAGALDEEPLPIALAPLDQPVGLVLAVVGFGVIDGDQLNGGGAKRQGDFPITAANRDYLTGGQDGRSICYGDSGGPAFLELDGALTVAGVTRSHFGECSGLSQWTRVDAYAGEFVLPFLDSWSGPCRLDGTCTSDGCRTPDPDCAPCGVDGVCSPGCPAIDLDCPVGGFFGDACATADDCESRLCIDDPDGGERYCTDRCDGGASCIEEALCQEVGGEPVCVARPPAEPEEGGGCAASDGTGGAPAGWLLGLLVSRLACCRAPRRRRRRRGTP